MKQLRLYVYQISQYNHCVQTDPGKKCLDSCIWLVYARESLYRCKVINPSFVRLRFPCRFVLIRVGYLSSSEAYTNNWDLFGKENYLGFDWWNCFWKILRRSEVTINLTRPLKKNASKWVLPLVVLYSEIFFRTYLAPVNLGCMILENHKNQGIVNVIANGTGKAIHMNRL